MHSEDAGILNQLFGDAPFDVHPLSPDVWHVRTDPSTSIIVKRVPRQARPCWKPGQPWAELVVLDLLAAEQAPVPQVLAADLEQGFMVMAFIEGKSLVDNADPSIDTSSLLRILTTSLKHIEKILGRFETTLRPYLLPADDTGCRAMFDKVAALLNPEARQAWSDLLAEGFDTSQPGPTLGSLDVQPGNAIVHDGKVTLIDFATVGWAHTEQRIVGYMHHMRPAPGTLLDDEGYRSYLSMEGKRATLRLAAYDFAFTAQMFTIAANEGDVAAGTRIIEVWKRPRTADKRVEQVRLGLDQRFLKEFAEATMKPTDDTFKEGWS